MLKVNKISEPDFFKEFKRKSKLKNWKDFDYKIKNELKEYMLENEQKFDGIYFCPVRGRLPLKKVRLNM